MSQVIAESTPRVTSPAIELLDVTVQSSHDSTPRLEGVNWKIEFRDFWVVGGLPGSGKSDLLATAAGLMRPAQGSHRIFGRDVWELRQDRTIEERLRIGVVFGEEGRVFHNLTVAENLALPLCYHRNCPMSETASRVEEILGLTGLTSLAHTTPGTMARTLRLRVALARALVLFPEVLLLDDPLRGMDPRQIRWWREFVTRLSSGHPALQGRPATLVMVTENFLPWINEGKKFAAIHDKTFEVFGDRQQVLDSAEPLLRDLIAD